MRKATKTVTTWLGVVAGIAGLEHGYFEFLQGNTRSTALAFPSWGPPCDPDKIWHACEPAMSILPNFLITGILAMLLSVTIIIWSGWFVQRKHGGLVLTLLSIALLLFGGGFFPPIIALVGGLAGTKINKPLTRQPGSLTRFAAKLWFWPLVIFLVWVLGQFPFGYFFNDILTSIMYFGMLLILTSLPLSVYTAYAHDSISQV
ncbi:MAG: hypothetical protein HY865_23320 [Chloroflexi bacterium]|nr:hypothetical protein [Chloroflexota bacterium]